MSEQDFFVRLERHVGGLFRCRPGRSPGWPPSSIGVVVAVDEIDREVGCAGTCLFVDGEIVWTYVGPDGIELLPREVGG